jgi:hypothetical protein
MPSIRLGNKKVRLPGSPLVRQAMGFGLVTGGVLGFLPVLGFWMLPLGVVVLSVDNKPVRRARRKVEVWWGRRRRDKAGAP